MSPTIDHDLVQQILSQNKRNLEFYLNGCTVQMRAPNKDNIKSGIPRRDGKWPNQTGPQRDYATFGNIDWCGPQQCDTSGPMRDGPRGLYFGLNSGPETQIKLIRHTDNKMRLKPKTGNDEYLASQTCGGSCNWWPFRMVVNKNGSNINDITTQFHITWSSNPSGIQDGSLIGPFIIASANNPNLKMLNSSWNVNTIGTNASGKSDIDTEWFFEVIELGDDLKEAYYKRLFDRISNVTRPISDTQATAAGLACCMKQFERPDNKTWVKTDKATIYPSNTPVEQCKKYLYTPASGNCDDLMNKFCKEFPDSILCGCSSYGTPLATSKTLPQQVKNWPQCFLKDCVPGEAYKFKGQLNTQTDGSNCPNITICNQNISAEDSAKLVDSLIKQDCSTKPSPTPSTPSTPSTLLNNKQINLFLLIATTITFGLGIILLILKKYGIALICFIISIVMIIITYLDNKDKVNTYVKNMINKLKKAS